MIPNDILIISKQFPFVAVGVRLQRTVFERDSDPVHGVARSRLGRHLRPLRQSNFILIFILGGTSDPYVKVTLSL